MLVAARWQLVWNKNAETGFGAILAQIFCSIILFELKDVTVIVVYVDWLTDAVIDIVVVFVVSVVDAVIIIVTDVVTVIVVIDAVVIALLSLM